MFDRMFEKRAIASFFVIMLLLLSCVLRIAVIINGDYADVAAKQIGYRITAGKLRGTIFDCNLVALTNREYKIIAAVSPTPQAIMKISSALVGEEKERVLEELKKGKPIICEVEKEIECDGIVCSKVYTHNGEENIATHIIGYVNSENRGVSGIEKAYDEVLFTDKTVDAVFCETAKGDLLYGIQPYFDNNLSVINSGVVTTLDINIQLICERAAKGIKSGAVIVADSTTNEIKAMVSKPDFDVLNVEKYLNDESAPLLNRSLECFSVGSAFKPSIAAAALENKKGSFVFDCQGKTHIIDRDFHCHNRLGHGLMNLQTALAQSCNCYFYNFALEIGAESVYKTARNLSVEGSIKIADGIKTSKGILPKIDTISTNAASLANLSIGQGELLLSPVAMLNLYSAIASDGTYNLPSVISGVMSGGNLKEYDRGNKTRAFSEKTAEVLRNYLASVINEGTGIEAKPEVVTAGGKTATAQTGRYDSSGVEITNSWFCGFFPLEKPQYTVIVMSEGKSEVTTASVFKNIADGITNYQNSIK